MKDPIQVAKLWYRKSTNETDDFDRFVYLWFALNALYNEFFESNERWAIGDLVYSEKYLIEMSVYQRILSKRYINFFKIRIIRDCSGRGNDTSENANIIKNNEYTLKKRFKALLMILYQVRCNLFHGNKSYELDSDQMVIKNASDALSDIVRGYLNIN